MRDIVLGQVHTGVFYVFDGLDQPVTGEVGNFVVTVTVDGVPKAKTVTITEVDNVDRKGEYQYSFTADEKRIWYLHITHPTYDPVGWDGNFRVVDKLAEDICLENLGPGDRVVEVYLEDNVTSNPIVNALVKVYDDTSTTLIAIGFTGADGKITFALYDGDHKVYISKIGQYTFTMPEDLTVAENPPPPDVQVTYYGTPFTPSPPPTPDTCVVFGWETLPDGSGATVEVEAEIMASNFFLQTNPHVIRKVVTTSDPNHTNGPGYWELVLTRTSQFAGDDEATYKFTIDDQRQGDHAIPDQDNIAFKVLVGL